MVQDVLSLSVEILSLIFGFGNTSIYIRCSDRNAKIVHLQIDSPAGDLRKLANPTLQHSWKIMA